MGRWSSIPENVRRPISKGNISHVVPLSSTSCRLTCVGCFWVLAFITERSDELMRVLLVFATLLQAPWWRLTIPSASKEWIVDPTLHNVRLRQKRRAGQPSRMAYKRLCCPMSTCLSVKTSLKRTPSRRPLTRRSEPHHAYSLWLISRLRSQLMLLLPQRCGPCSTLATDTAYGNTTGFHHEGDLCYCQLATGIR